MNDLERQIEERRRKSRDAAEAWRVTADSAAAKRNQLHRDFVDLMNSNNMAPQPYFNRTHERYLKAGLKAFLMNRRDEYVVTYEFKLAGQCWVFAISQFGHYYAMTAGGELLRVARSSAPKPSDTCRVNLDADAKRESRAGRSLVLADGEGHLSDEYIVSGAQSLIDGAGEIYLSDGK